MSTPIIPAWWPTMPRPGNFGDIITPYLIKKITEKTPYYVNKDFTRFDRNLLAVGSIVRMANSKTIVWGSGAMNSGEKISPLGDYRAVRGPLTRSLIIEQGGSCPEVYGDPALLLPKFYTPKSSKMYKFGIIPHYVDYDQVREWYKDDDDIKVINLLTDDIEPVIDAIHECENVISSSLHGIIVAHAYGVGAAWVKFSNKLAGDGIKFNDYFASVDVDMSCTTVTEKLDSTDLSAIQYTKDITYDGTLLLNAFPHNSFSYRI